jgi:hypothetical protein
MNAMGAADLGREFEFERPAFKHVHQRIDLF